MSLMQTLGKPFIGFNKAMDYLSPIFDLGVRLWVAYAFFKSGLTKIQSWESTKMLFEYEYEVPLLPPDIAAYLGTAAELGLPVLLAVGLASRLSALALFVFNIVAIISYPFLMTDEGAAGLQQHYLWGTMLLVTLFHGPGRFSVDYLICRKCV